MKGKKIIIILTFCLFIFKCSPENNFTEVTISIAPKSVSLSQELLFIDRLLRFFSTEAFAQVPSEVTSIALSVAGSGMTIIEKNYPSDITSITLNVPAGPGRIFTVDGFSGENSLYRGTSGPIDLNSGEGVDLSITMEPYNRGKIYVTNYADDQVTVIDGGTNTVDTTITVGDGPGGIGINNITGFAYVSNDIAGTISVIDTATNTVTNTLSNYYNNSGSNPLFIVDVNPNTNKIYISQGTEELTVTLINGDDNSVSDIDTMSGSYTFGVCVNTGTNKIYVSKWDYPAVFNGLTDALLGYVSGGSWSEARDICANSNTNKIYVVSDYGTTGFVSVVDGSTDAFSTSIVVGSNPYGISVNPETNKIYVANYGSGTVSVIDGSTDSVSTTIPVGTNPVGVAVNPVSNTIYVANWGSQSVSVISGLTDTVIATVTVGTNPAFLEVLK